MTNVTRIKNYYLMTKIDAGLSAFLAAIFATIAIFTPFWVTVGLIVGGAGAVSLLLATIVKDNAISCYIQDADDYDSYNHGRVEYSWEIEARADRLRPKARKAFTTRSIIKALVFNKPASIQMKHEEIPGRRGIVTHEFSVSRSGVGIHKIAELTEIALWEDAMANAKSIR